MTARRLRPDGTFEDRFDNTFTLAAGLLACALAAALCAPSMAATPSAARSAEISGHSFRSSDGVRLHVLETRPASSTASTSTSSIVLVPGWSMPASLFRAQLKALGRHHHVVAF